MLWVKGSGGDIGTMKLDGFATLYMEKLLALPALYRGPEDEDEIVGLYPHCTFNLNPRARQHRYAAARAHRPRARRPHASRCGDRHRRLGGQPAR